MAFNGLDPVKLVMGRKAKGSAAISATYGLYTYRFVSKADERLFKADPIRYAVQLGGSSLDQWYTLGNPACYLLHNGKLYLATDNKGLAKVSANPDRFIKQFDGRRKVAIMVFPGVQVIDYSGPYEVFSEAGYEVYIVSADPNPILTAGFSTIVPTYTFANCPKPDVIVLPGGNVDFKIPSTDPRIAWVHKMSTLTPHILSVCNGAFWLANAGLLDGKQATTFFGLITSLHKNFPKVQIVSEKRFADNGQIVCSAGLSSGIDGALHMVEKIDGLGAAKNLALGMEYDWHPDNGFVRASLADKYLRFTFGSLAFPDDADQKVLDVTDTKDAFDKVWMLSGAKMSADQLAASLAKQLSTAWKRADPAGPSVSKMLWTFTGDDSTTWTAECAVQPVGPDKLKVHIHLERAASTAIQKHAGASHGTLRPMTWPPLITDNRPTGFH